MGVEIKEMKDSCYSSEDIVILKRAQVGNENDYFSKTFLEYKNGFSSKGELWFGLENLYKMTATGSWRLVVTLKDWDDKIYKAEYHSFKVGHGDDYELSVNGFDETTSTLG